MKDYYAVLDIPFSATADDVKKAYRKLALQYHPDKNKATDAAARFIEIHEAYEILYNEEKRRYYDNLFIRKSTEKPKEEQFNNWAKEAHYHAEEYAEMPYEFYVEKVYTTLLQAHETTRLWAFMLAAVAVSITSVVLFFLSIYRIVIGDNEFENSLMLSWLLLGIFAVVGIRGFIIIAGQLFGNANSYARTLVKK